ncbi:MAG: hypothetical protein HQM10_04365 [Candidatus Riflebacteria bacterium]|nr:hypothetical protein [Candidatus Riflebacteria bacterium]
MFFNKFVFSARSLYVFVAVLSVVCFPLSLTALTSIKAGDMEITSKLMTFQNNLYVARGGMKATQKESVLTSERGIYDRSLELVKAIDNVEVVQPGSVLTSDYLEAYVNEDRILAKGNPKLVRISDRESRDESGKLTSKKVRIILTCDEVEGFNKENRFLAKGNVHVVEVPYREGETEEEEKENEGKPTSDLKCETLEIFSNEDKAIARNDVLIITKTMRATGDKAIYLDKENRLIIVGKAHAIQTSRENPDAQEQVSELHATKIIYYPNEDRTIAVGEVHATVYPKGAKPGGDEEDTKDRKKKKKKDSESEDSEELNMESPSDEESSGKKGEKGKNGKKGKDFEKPSPVEELASSDAPPGDLPEGLPEGDYTPVGGEPSDAPPDE